VTRVVDGDTVVVLAHSTRDRFPITVPGKPPRIESVIVRLAEIDAPELKSGFGPASKAVLADMILHKQVVVTWERRGRYRRIIGQVYADGEWVNLSMVAQGWAWQFRRYSRSRELAAAEREARSRKVGCWQAAQHSDLAVAAAGDVQEMIRGR
jgi:endonuclease YncB( thermonuclease family)